MEQLKNKIAIITGAGGGFGEGIAQAYVREGAKIIVADIQDAAAKRVAASLGAQASAFTCDVSNAAQVQALVQWLTTLAPRIKTVPCWKWMKPLSTKCSMSM